ncbi:MULTISPECIES: hypothetical protein [unclassified Nocardia]|uniref:hypothetical protein n=1 Tax=unclassified Nocardia TaxID=2637762 RepID=UPI001CE3B97B|nr:MULTISPECIES: hypothetical protein [unclassified Nocardia]
MRAFGDGRKRGGQAQTDWLTDFLLAAAHRARQPPPEWNRLRPLPSELGTGLARFPARWRDSTLLASSTGSGDPDYVAAVRLYLAEKAEHARLIDQIAAADAEVRRARHGRGLSAELRAQLVTGVIAARYFRALRDGTIDPVLTEVARRIHADQMRHLEFHKSQLRTEYAHPGPLRRTAARALCWAQLCRALTVTAVEQRAALRFLGVRRREFASDTVVLFRHLLRRIFARATTAGLPS